MIRSLVLMACLVAIYPASAIAIEKTLLKKPSLYSTILVKQNGNTICLLFSVRKDQRNQSCINTRRPKAMVFAYTRMSMSALLFSPDPRSVLVVGLGGGTVPTALAELFPNAKIDAIEIDPAVVEVAKSYFGFTPSENLKVHTADARVWIKRQVMKNRTYDIVLLDAFNGEYIPEHLMTKEFFTDVRSLLSPSGIVVSNTFAISALYDHESVTYASVFPDFINFKIPESANRVVLAPNRMPNDDLLTERANEMAKKLKPYAVPINRYARVIKRQRKKSPDWDTNAQVLTDQFSPANLLKDR